jgi:hypothetical protein
MEDGCFGMSVLNKLVFETRNGNNKTTIERCVFEWLTVRDDVVCQ